MKQLFEIGPQYLGGGGGGQGGRAKFAWQPSGTYIAVVGDGQRQIFLFDRTGAEVVEEIPLKMPGVPIVGMEWDPDGRCCFLLI